jgi:hypothetical protein
MKSMRTKAVEVDQIPARVCSFTVQRLPPRLHMYRKELAPRYSSLIRHVALGGHGKR